MLTPHYQAVDHTGRYEEEGELLDFDADHSGTLFKKKHYLEEGRYRRLWLLTMARNLESTCIMDH